MPANALVKIIAFAVSLLLLFAAAFAVGAAVDVAPPSAGEVQALALTREAE